MKNKIFKVITYNLAITTLTFGFSACAAERVKPIIFSEPQKADSSYLSNIIIELQKKWPNNRYINLVFHGHSVPSGYQATPIVNTFGSYPVLSLKLITDKYPFAVVNVIKTTIGGENAEQGSKRFASDVLTKKPDVIFIDYALNDRSIGLERAKVAWESMIIEAQNANVKLILLTPSPDLTENIKDSNAPLAQHTAQILSLGAKYHIPVINSYKAFKDLALSGIDLTNYMSQSNHINPTGHQIVAGLIMNLFY